MIRTLILLSYLLQVQAQATSTAEYSQKWKQASQLSKETVTNLKPAFRWVDGALAFKKQSRDPQSGKITEQWVQVQLADGQAEEGIDPKQLPKQSTETKKRPSRKSSRRGKKSDSRQDSPDGQWRASIEDGRVFLQKLGSDSAKKPLGAASENGSYYTGPISWSPSSTHFMARHVQPGQRRTITLVESSPKKQLQPKLLTVRYDKPGDHIDRTEPRIFSLDGQSEHAPDPKLTVDQYSLGEAEWNHDGSALLYEYIERGFGKHYLISMDAKSGEQRLIAKEESDTYIHVYGIRYRKDLTETGEIIWGSDRDGWRHLYLLDAKSGSVKHRITQGNWFVRDVIDVDTEARQLVFSASGKNPGEDPYHLHYYRVNFDGSELTALTQGDGTHKLEFSPDGSHYIDTWSRVDHPPVYELRRSADGSLVRELLRADASSWAQHGLRMPERFHCKDRNGRFDVWGVIITPPNYDPNKKYPVIEHIYAGPHSAFVPKAFRTSYHLMTEFAAEGFVVVQIDALGTNYRHHDFTHFCYKNLVDSGFPDRIKWIKAAAATRPYIDTSRVGILGGSAGGQSSTAAMLHQGEFYKAAASDCGCHDNRMDKIWWNEQWMDWPIGPHYEQQANSTHAAKLQGALMLTVGELDTNVDPSSTTQLVDALLKADKDFEYYLVPGAGHGCGEKPHMRRKRIEFFKKHLGGAQ